MPQDVDIRLSLGQINQEEQHRKAVARRLNISPKQISHLELLKRSIDGRKRPPVFQLRYRVWLDEPVESTPMWEPPQNEVHNAPPVLIVGFGPAGMFAAIQLIELGYRPIVLERGRDVRARRRDLAAINKEGIVNPDSNYCFGEGGAGTFSDGKLYTRSKKRGDVRRILEILVAHGATTDILIDAHPHIGTNKLPQIIQAMRESIIERGGEVIFNARVTELIQQNGATKGVRLADGTAYNAEAVVLATGHSARDIFEMVHREGLDIEAKPYALGVRVEHPQPLIDKLRYHTNSRPEVLPAASYSLVTQARGLGVYSFCMCPGGIICPAATQNDELVVNGWSPSKRNSPYANSGIVVEVPAEELARFEQQGPFAGIGFQREIEQRAFQVGGGKQVAPGQRLTDFIKGVTSQNLPDNSYLPGMRPSNLADVLPQSILERLQEGFRAFDKKMPGYLSREALVVATESRTSSPVKIPRDHQSLMHPQSPGLFPCGEGPGYAGGIMSAGMDGERVARAVAMYFEKA